MTTFVYVNAEITHSSGRVLKKPIMLNLDSVQRISSVKQPNSCEVTTNDGQRLTILTSIENFRDLIVNDLVTDAPAPEDDKEVETVEALPDPEDDQEETFETSDDDVADESADQGGNTLTPNAKDEVETGKKVYTEGENPFAGIE